MKNLSLRALRRFFIWSEQPSPPEFLFVFWWKFSVKGPVLKNLFTKRWLVLNKVQNSTEAVEASASSELPWVNINLSFPINPNLGFQQAAQINGFGLELLTGKSFRKCHHAHLSCWRLIFVREVEKDKKRNLHDGDTWKANRCSNSPRWINKTWENLQVCFSFFQTFQVLLFTQACRALKSKQKGFKF